MYIDSINNKTLPLILGQAAFSLLQSQIGTHFIVLHLNADFKILLKY